MQPVRIDIISDIACPWCAIGYARLVKWAAEQGKQTEMKKALFEAYFHYDAVISDSAVLVHWVESIGLDGEAAQKMLASDQYVQTVREEEARWQQMGISSVPAFVINDQYLISGAQEPEMLVKSLRSIVSN
ncbi:DsbA family oxidoreductase [Nitrincola iocasae]|uniref:DSBA-like thioredoxin domain-containing protein n=1 Tax=Nitrincola iocasae TaxID=2614693 RepID=A0A5J6LF40_9GAMM|nr:DsbA family protein [Nitrincola iocasae]QEW07240.1 hypothetical protein F5I99_12400 [Nitrincola iocasae]